MAANPLRSRRRLAAALSLALALILPMLLTACSADGPPRPCPALSILADAETVTRFRPGGGRDLLDVLHQAELTNAGLTCSYDDGVVTTALTVDLIAMKGPAADADRANFPFFVAVVGDGQQILGKRVFDSEVVFPENRRRAGVREEIEQVVPIPSGQDGAGLEVLVGFQLTREELRYNRERQGR